MFKYSIIIDDYIKRALNENNYEAYIEHERIEEANCTDDKKIEILYKDGKKEKLKPGKALKKIIDGELRDHEIGDIVERLVCISDIERIKSKYEFRIEKNVHNYYSKERTVMENELGRSCMIYSESSSEEIKEDTKKDLRWYKENKLEIAILLENRKIVARSIIWDVSSVPGGKIFKVHDRIYFTNPESRDAIKENLENMGIKDIKEVGDVYFKLKSSYKRRPWLDTMGNSDVQGYLNKKKTDAIMKKWVENRKKGDFVAIVDTYYKKGNRFLDYIVREKNDEIIEEILDITTIRWQGITIDLLESILKNRYEKYIDRTIEKISDGYDRGVVENHKMVELIENLLKYKKMNKLYKLLDEHDFHTIFSKSRHNFAMDNLVDTLAEKPKIKLINKFIQNGLDKEMMYSNIIEYIYLKDKPKKILREMDLTGPVKFFGKCIHNFEKININVIKKWRKMI